MADITASEFTALTGITVGGRDTNLFTQSIFDILEPIAKERLDAMASGVQPQTYKLLLANMIAHLWTVRTTDTSLSSERIGDYSYTRKADSQSKYMEEILSILRTLGGGGGMVVTIPDTDRGAIDNEVLRW